jgi:hypothetical protein
VSAAGLVAALDVAGRLAGVGSTDPTSPSQQGRRLMQERPGSGPASLTLVFSDGAAGSGAAGARGAR